MGCCSVNRKEQKEVILLLGGPGSGKKTQCAKIASLFGFETLNVQELRENKLKEKKEAGTKTVEETIKDKEEISDAETVECVKEALKEKKGKTVLLIGFPRSKESLAEWKKAMIGEYEIKFVLYLECDSEELKKRVSANGLGTEEVEKEIKAFETETAPIIKDYEGNDMVMKINAKGNVEEVFEEIKKSFIEKKIEKVVKE